MSAPVSTCSMIVPRMVLVALPRHFRAFHELAVDAKIWRRPLEFRKPPLDRLDAMTVLLAAVESGSLSKASRELHLPLATVSRKVAELEAYLKADLLIRSAKGLELTPA